MPELFFIVTVFESVVDVYRATRALVVGLTATTQNGLIRITRREKPRRDRLKRHIPDMGFYRGIKISNF
jgi:hypothetical protein